MICVPDRRTCSPVPGPGRLGTPARRQPRGRLVPGRGCRGSFPHPGFSLASWWLRANYCVAAVCTGPSGNHTRGTRAQGDQSVSDRPVTRLGLPQGLLRHSDKDAALVTLHQEGDGVLVVSLGDSVAYFLHRLYRLAVHLTDDITSLQARALRRAAGLDTDDHDTRRLLQTTLTSHLRCDLLEL